MRHVLTLAAVFAVAAVSAAQAQKIDDKGRCHGPDGKYAKMEVCKPAVHHTYKLDAKGGCHDETGKFAKKAMCH